MNINDNGENENPQSADNTAESDTAAAVNVFEKNIRWIALVCAAFCIIAGAAAGLRYYFSRHPDMVVSGDAGWSAPDYVSVKLIPVNEYSRPGTKLDAVNGLVIHYVGNPGTSAEANRSYFAGLAASGATYASSNFIIGIDGEVLECVPADEVAYCSNNRNSDTLSIECCHPGEDGKFTDATYASLVRLAADLCVEFDLDPERDIIRHYDITEKLCPLYYVENTDAWEALKADIAEAVNASRTAEIGTK